MLLMEEGLIAIVVAGPLTWAFWEKLYIKSKLPETGDWCM
jgi:hypothetical protein